MGKTSPVKEKSLLTMDLTCSIEQVDTGKTIKLCANEPTQLLNSPTHLLK